MKKWHITITENETGSIKLDIDTDAIVAGIDENDGTRVFHVANCPVPDHAAAMFGVQQSIQESVQRNPVLGMMLMMLARAEQEHAETVEEAQE